MAVDAVCKAFGIQGQHQSPTLNAHIDQAISVACTHFKCVHAQGCVAQALINVARVQRGPLRQGQKFAGVFALMISASSGPMFLKLCGRVVGM